MLLNTNFFLQCLPKYITNKLLNNTLIPPVSLLFNNENFNHEFLFRLDKFKNLTSLNENKLIKTFRADIKASEIDGILKDFMIDHAVFFISVLLLSRSRDDIEDILNSKIFPASFEDLELIKNRIYTIQNMLQVGYDTSTTTNRNIILHDICFFYDDIFQEIINQSNDECIFLHSFMLPSTATLKEITKKRLLLLSMFPNDKMIYHKLQNITYPKNYSIRAPNKQKRLKPILFKDLKLYFPKTLNNFSESKLYTFYRLLFLPHITKSPTMYQKFPNKKFTNIGQQFTDSEILQMIFVFCLENWQQVWKLNFPCGVEIVRRLNFLKTEEKWTPDTNELINYLVLHP